MRKGGGSVLLITRERLRCLEADFSKLVHEIYSHLQSIPFELHSTLFDDIQHFVWRQIFSNTVNFLREVAENLQKRSQNPSCFCLKVRSSHSGHAEQGFTAEVEFGGVEPTVSMFCMISWNVGCMRKCAMNISLL